MTTLPTSKKIVAFDTFGEFPETEYQNDVENREAFIEKAGKEGLFIEELEKMFSHKGLDTTRTCRRRYHYFCTQLFIRESLAPHRR